MLKPLIRLFNLLTLFTLFTFLSTEKSNAQTTYTWIGASGGSWAVSTNWSPTRTTPAVTDIIVFNNGAPIIVTGVITQTIRQLIINNSTDVSLQSAAAAVLSINGPSASTNLQIAASSVLQLSSAAAASINLTIVTTANQTGDISGSLVLNANTSSNNTFTTSSVGTTVVTVANGGSIINNGGAVTSTAATLVFAPGSLYRHARNAGTIPTATWTNTPPYSNIVITSPTTGPAGFGQSFGNVTLNTGMITTNVAGTATINGTLTINNGNLALLAGTLVLNGDLVVSTGSIVSNTGATLIIGGTAPNLTIPPLTGGATLHNLTINRPSGVTLGGALTIFTNGELTLTNGILTTTATNYIRITNTAVAGILGGSPSSYVNGPIQRAFASNLASGSTYAFPVGKSTYNLFELVNPTTGGSSGIITVEAFDADCGGFLGFGLSALNTNRYWQATPNIAFITSSSVRLTEPSLGAANRVAQCGTINGTYMNRGGSAPSPVLSGPVSPTLGYFTLGTDAAIALNGTYTVGPTGQFAKLTDVANALNVATVTGNVVFELQTDYDGTVGETYPIMFYQYAMTGGPWKATVRPAATVSAMLTTSGTTASTGLINFSGVDLLSFDGRPGGTGTMANIQWSITHTGAASSYPALQFLNGASNNSMKFLNIKASCTNTTGTIVFSTSTVAGGNSNDTISDCNIGNYTTQPYNAILSAGTAGANANSGNCILRNNIYNFQSFTSYSTFPLNGGVIISATGNGSNWNVSNNSFYANQIINGRSAACIFMAPGAASTGNIVSGNFIGGQSPMCGGAYMDYRGTWNGNGWDFWGIYVNSGGTSVSNNTIQNVKMGLTTASNHFCGINIVSGPATITGNTIGSPSVCKSILNGSAGQVFGISNVGSSPVTISNNVIANVISDFSNPPSAFNQSGVCGISCNMPGGVVSPNIITNNEIFNLANGDNYNGSYVISGWNFGSSGASYGPMSATNCKGGSVLSTFGAHMIMVVGIYLQQWNATNVTHTISNNRIYGLNSTVTGGSNNSYIIGIFDNTYGTNYTSNINANRIYGFYAPDSYGVSGTNYTGLIGIFAPPNQLGTHYYTNNMIQLGYKMDGTSVRNASITGIWDNSNWNSPTLKMNFYHNSVYIGGTDNTCLNSYTFRRSLIYSSAAYDLVDLKNNIFVNNRSSASADHYGIFVNDKINFTSNYNLIYGTGTGFVFGNLSGISYANLAAWQTASLLDANTIQNDPLYINPFVIAPDLHLQAGSPAIGAGTSSTVTTDYDGSTRSGAMDMGADQYAASYSTPYLGITGCNQELPLPVELLDFHAECNNNHAELRWSTATETNNDYFSIEQSKDALEWENIATIAGSGNSGSIRRYYYFNEGENISDTYYRLSQTDYDGKSVTLGIIYTNCREYKNNNDLICYPNPSKDDIMVKFRCDASESAVLLIYDALGNKVFDKSLTDTEISSGAAVLHLQNLPAGIYSLKLFSASVCRITQLIRTEKE